MNKIVISTDEVAAVVPELPTGQETPRLPSALPIGLKIGLPFLVLVLPLLCLATIGVWLYARAKEPRVLHACVRYCCALLVISGLLTSLVLGIVLLIPATPREVMGFVPPIKVVVPAPEKLAGNGATLTPRELAARATGQVFIVTEDRKGWKPTIKTVDRVGFGTAVLVFAGKDDYLFATSRHVLDGEDWRSAEPYSGDALLLDRDGGASTAQVIARHRDLDLMLLRVPRGSEGPEFAQPILDFEKVAQGERIMIFGHPQGLFFSLADGLVSRTGEGGLIQITAPVSPGASGGPVFDFQGRLLGIVSSMLDRRANPYAENLNFAVCADSLLQPDQWEASEDSRALLQNYATSVRAGPAATAIPASQP